MPCRWDRDWRQRTSEGSCIATFLTKQGRVKILDFGLAKLRHFAGSADEASGTTVTEPGVVMGTVGYMSPEQVRGQEADARSDIFSFGAILYEMLSGRRAFQGNSAIDTRSAILKEDPPELCIAVSPAIERVVRRCLEKNPDERLQTARDVSFALEAMSASRTAGWTWLRPRYLITTASALAVMAIALAWMYWRPFSGEPSFPPMETVPITSFPGIERSPSFSPDGSQIAFTWNGENRDKRDIYVMQVGGAHPFHLTSGVRPAWSPDSREIAFIRFNPDKATILSIGPLGGPERKLAEGIIDGFGLNWAPDGKHLAFSYKDSQQEPWSICLLSVDTLQGERLTSPPPGSYGDRCPAFSPDGSHLGFVRELAPGTTMDLYVLSLSGGEPRRLTADGRAIDSICWTAEKSSFNRTGQEVPQPCGESQSPGEALNPSKELGTMPRSQISRPKGSALPM